MATQMCSRPTRELAIQHVLDCRGDLRSRLTRHLFIEPRTASVAVANYYDHIQSGARSGHGIMLTQLPVVRSQPNVKATPLNRGNPVLLICAVNPSLKLITFHVL